MNIKKLMLSTIVAGVIIPSIAYGGTIFFGKDYSHKRGTHEVQKGESLANIAKEYCMTEAEMWKLNPSEKFISGKRSLIFPGEKVKFKYNCPKKKRKASNYEHSGGNFF